MRGKKCETAGRDRKSLARKVNILLVNLICKISYRDSYNAMTNKIYSLKHILILLYIYEFLSECFVNITMFMLVLMETFFKNCYS